MYLTSTASTKVTIKIIAIMVFNNPMPSNRDKGHEFMKFATNVISNYI